jgi:hypothetical protein
MDDIDIRFTKVRFNGSLLKPNVFREDAGPQVDVAWKSLGADCNSSPILHHQLSNMPAPDSAARVPTDKASKSGLAPDQVKIKDKYGGGYPAHVEGMHHLHCLVCPPPR